VKAIAIIMKKMALDIGSPSPAGNKIKSYRPALVTDLKDYYDGQESALQLLRFRQGL
jgi:hypothetical protein